MATELLRAGDLFAISAPPAIGYFLYIFPSGAALDSRYLGAILAGALAGAAFFQCSGIYARGSSPATRSGLGRVLIVWICVCAVLLTIAFSLKISAEFSRVWAFGWFAGTAALLVLGRIVFSVAIGLGGCEKYLAERTVVWGAGEQGERLAEHLANCADGGLELIGFIDDRKTRVREGLANSLLGNTDELIAMVRRGEVDQILVALPWAAERRLTEILNRLGVLPVAVHLAPDLAALALGGRKVARFANIPMITAQEQPISGWSHVLKDVKDRVLAALLLLFLAPLLGLIAVAIKADSSGPVLFRQPRRGFNDQLIDVFKFRTMYHHLSDQHCQQQTAANDARVTRVGRFLRRTSLDELPQLLNVLLGEMSLVGPRPHALGTSVRGLPLEDLVDQYARRHKVKPGITGWAQVNGWRGELDTEQKIKMRVEYDLYYIENWSIWLDLWILARTFLLVFRDKNAY